jgi:hypothetical protein
MDPRPIYPAMGRLWQGSPALLEQGDNPRPKAFGIAQLAGRRDLPQTNKNNIYSNILSFQFLMEF